MPSRTGTTARRRIRSIEEMLAPPALSGAGISCTALVAALLLVLSVNCAAVGAASGSTRLGSGFVGEASLRTPQTRQEESLHLKDFLLLLRGKAVSAYNYASGRTGESGSRGGGSSSRTTRLNQRRRNVQTDQRRDSDSDSARRRNDERSIRVTTRNASSSGDAARNSAVPRELHAERRTLAEIASGVKDNSDGKPKQKKIESPYTLSLQPDSSQGKIESWTPQKNRYLVALCVYGRLSNQEKCLRNYIIIAALLQRTLVIPTESCGVSFSTLCWRWGNIVDVARMRACLAPAYGTNETVITVEEYVAREGRDVAIDHIACVMDHTCLYNWAIVKEHYPQITLPDKVEYPTTPKEVNAFLHTFAYNDAPVISLGDCFSISLRGLPFHIEGAVPPFKTTCADIWQPPPVIENFANGFIDTFLGSEYAAVHLRRSDFAKFQNSDDETKRDTFLPIVTVAHFIMERFKDTGASVVYLATDASPSEIQLLEQLFLGSGSRNPLVVVRMPEFVKESEEYSQFPWLKRFLDLDSDGNGSLKALAEKHICANARFFIGTRRSTFSYDILRLRLLHRRMSGVDAFLSDDDEA